MIAYRAETRMMPALIAAQAKSPMRESCSVPCSPPTPTSFPSPAQGSSAFVFSASQITRANALWPLSLTNSTKHAPSTPAPTSPWSTKCPEKHLNMKSRKLDGSGSLNLRVLPLLGSSLVTGSGGTPVARYCRIVPIREPQRTIGRRKARRAYRPRAPRRALERWPGGRGRFHQRARCGLLVREGAGHRPAVPRRYLHDLQRGR